MQPDKIVNAIIAIDKNTQGLALHDVNPPLVHVAFAVQGSHSSLRSGLLLTENGCMRLLTRSHRLGRVQHGTFAGQAGADPERVVAAMKLEGHTVECLFMEPVGIDRTWRTLDSVRFVLSRLLYCMAASLDAGGCGIHAL